MRITSSLAMTAAMLLVGVSALAQTVSSASADRATGSASIDQWVGVSVGGEVGWLSQAFNGSESYPINPPGFAPHIFTFDSPSNSGAGLSGTVGYLVKVADNFAVGLDVHFLRSAVIGPGAITGFNNSEDLTTFKARVGRTIAAQCATTVNRKVLVYSTVGIALLPVTAAEAFLAVTNGSVTQTMKGPTVGVGFGFAPWNRSRLRHLTVGAEFVYTFFGSQTFTFEPVGTRPNVIIPTSASASSRRRQLDVVLTYRLF